MYLIKYEVEGYDGTYQAGPYSESEVESQKADIAGYEGVFNVQVVPVSDSE